LDTAYLKAAVCFSSFFIEGYLCLMRIDVITVLPELLESPLSHSIMKRAQTKGLLQVYTHNLRQWAVN
jgi:hypothetical protein